LLDLVVLKINKLANTNIAECCGVCCYIVKIKTLMHAQVASKKNELTKYNAEFIINKEKKKYYLNEI
jgi:hypothetical protein